MRTPWNRSNEADRANAEVIEVPAGVLVLRGEQKAEADDPGIRTAGGSSRIVRAWSGTDIKDPEQSFDHVDRQRADRDLQLHRQGTQGVPGRSPVTSPSAARTTPWAATPLRHSQHFAIALDNELVSAPYINWRENSEGIDGSTGAQISGSFTIQSAQDLATILKIGALPLKLTRCRARRSPPRSVSEALDQGLNAGIAGFPSSRCS